MALSYRVLDGHQRQRDEPAESRPPEIRGSETLVKEFLLDESEHAHGDETDAPCSDTVHLAFRHQPGGDEEVGYAFKTHLLYPGVHPGLPFF